MRRFRYFTAILVFIAASLTACTTPVPVTPASVSEVAMPKHTRHLKIGLALGGGAARGFAHIGVIKALELHIPPNLDTRSAANWTLVPPQTGRAFRAKLDTLDVTPRG